MEELIEELNKNGVSGYELLTWLKSESVWTCLRHGIKSPSSTGVDECDDSYYQDLYEFITVLNK